VLAFTAVEAAVAVLTAVAAIAVLVALTVVEVPAVVPFDQLIATCVVRIHMSYILLLLVVIAVQYIMGMSSDFTTLLLRQYSRI
jgi:hypothetical protein